MIDLDTNVLSEVVLPDQNPRIVAWLMSKPSSSLFTTTVTQAELLHGIGVLPEGRRRERLAAAVRAILADEFGGRNLSFDMSAAESYATITVQRRIAGRPIAAFDAQIAAIARSRGASVATRNVKDFEGSGVNVIDPWAS